MTGKPINNRAWLFVLPVLAFVLFSSIIPVMTVVNDSIQDTMGATISSGMATPGFATS